MISDILNKLVHDYMESVFVNSGRDIGFYKARSELLGCGRVFFYEKDTSNHKYVNHKGCLSVAVNPIVADVNGVFELIEGAGSYRIEVADSRGCLHLICEVNNEKA